MNLTELRQKYPDYKDMSDEEFVSGFHKKFYSDIPEADFHKKIGFSKGGQQSDGLYRKSYEEEYLPSVKQRQSRVSIPGAEAYDKAPAMSYEEYAKGKNQKLKEKVLGPLDAAATIGTSLTAGAGAALAAPVFTAAKNGKNVLQNYEDIYNKLTWTPKTDTGEDILMGLAPIVGAFPPVGGYLPALSRIRSGKKAPVPGPQMPPTPDFNAIVQGSTPDAVKPPVEVPNLRLELPEVADRRVAEQNRQAVRGADDWNSMEHAARAVEEEILASEQARKAADAEALAAEQLRTHEFLRDAQQTVIDDHPYGDRPAQFGMTDIGGRLDENGIPIRADLSMEAQNLQDPLQRNLWGDELPGRSQDGSIGLTQALDKMPPGEARDTAMSQLRGQRGAIDLPAVLESLQKFKQGLLSPKEYVKSFVGAFNPELTHDMGWKYALEESLDPKSRSRMVLMSPDTFHKLALPRDPEYKTSTHSSARRGNIEEALTYKKEGLDSIPMLKVDSGKVFGHEGRHRMDVFKEMGVEQVPVILRDSVVRNEAGKLPYKFLISEGTDSGMPRHHVPMDRITDVFNTPETPLNSGMSRGQRGALDWGDSKTNKFLSDLNPFSKEKRFKKVQAHTTYLASQLEDSFPAMAKIIKRRDVQELLNDMVDAENHPNPIEYWQEKLAGVSAADDPTIGGQMKRIGRKTMYGQARGPKDMLKIELTKAQEAEAVQFAEAIDFLRKEFVTGKQKAPEPRNLDTDSYNWVGGKDPFYHDERMKNPQYARDYEAQTREIEAWNKEANELNTAFAEQYGFDPSGFAPSEWRQPIDAVWDLIFGTARKVHTDEQAAITRHGLMGMGRSQMGGVDFEAMSKYLKDTLFSFGNAKDLTPSVTGPRVMSPEQVAQRTELRSKANAVGLKDTPYNRITSLEEAIANPGPDLTRSLGRDELGSGVENIIRLHPKNNLEVYARTVVQDARNLTERAIKNYLTNDKDGVVVFWRKMNQDQKNNVIALWQALDRHQKPLTEDILNQSGFDANQKAFLTKVMDANDGLYSIKASELAAQGFDPHFYRRGYMPGIFTGAYRTLIGTRKADGSFSIQAVAQADTKLGHKKALEYYKQKLGDGVEYVTLPRQGMSTVAGHGRSTLNQGLSTLLLEIAKRDENFADIKKFVEQKVADDFSNMYNFQVHEKMKKGVEGAVGKRPWLDVSTNTNEFFKAYMDYMEEGFRYSYYQKPLNELSKVVNNPELQNSHPKTLTHLNKYIKHLAGVSLNSFGAAGNAAIDSVAKLLTVGTGKVNTIKHEATHWSSLHMMGGPNLGFFLMQLTQVITGGAPEAVALRNALGIDPVQVSTKLIPESGHALVKLSMEKLVGKPADVPQHLRDAYTWAHEVGMFTFSEAELAHQVNQGPVRKKVDKVMGAPIEYGERMTRPTVFMMYANMFDAAGFKGEDGFARAQAATDWAMGNYHPDERPMIYQSLGFIGHMAGALATYKHNFIGQHIARVKDARNNPGALVLSGALGLGLYGLMGLPFSQEASDLAEYFTDKPVRDMIMDSPDDPNGWLDGMLSFITDLDFQSRLSQSSLFPDTPLSALPHINNFLTVLGKGFEVGKTGGQDMSAWEGLGKQMLPAGARGFVEGPVPKNAKTGMNKFDQARTPEEQTIRKILGVKPMRESLEEKNTFARQRIELRRQAKLRDASTRFDRAILEKDKMGQAKAEQDYIRNGGDIRELTNSQRIQDMLTKSQMSDRQRKAGIPTQNINTINKYEAYNP